MNLSQEDTAKLVAMVAAAMTKGPKGRRNKPRKQGVSRSSVPVEQRKEIFTEAVKEAFKAAGYGEVTPNEDVLTYNRWLEKGFKVKPGQKAVRVKDKLHRRGQGLPLFHHSQVEAVAS